MKTERYNRLSAQTLRGRRRLSPILWVVVIAVIALYITIGAIYGSMAFGEGVSTQESECKVEMTSIMVDALILSSDTIIDINESTTIADTAVSQLFSSLTPSEKTTIIELCNYIEVIPEARDLLLLEMIDVYRLLQLEEMMNVIMGEEGI